MFKNMKIATKVRMVALIGVIGLLIVAATVIPGLNSIGSEIEEIAQYQIPLNTVVTELEKDILEEEILTYQLVIAANDEDKEKIQQIEHHIEKLEHETDITIKKAEELAKKAIEHNHDNEKAKKGYKKFLHELETIEHLQTNFEKSLKIFEHNIKTGQLAHYEQEIEELHHELNSMDGNITMMMHQMDGLLKHSTHQAEKDEHTLVNTIWIVGILVFLIASIISYIIAKQVQNSIKNFEHGLLSFFKYLNREVSTIEHLDDSKKDEIGTMAKVVNQNITKTKTNIEEDRKVIDDTIEVLSEFEQGDLCQRVSSNSSNPALQELTKLLNQMGGNIETNIDNVLDVLEQYSNSNYINKVDTKDIKEHLLKLANGVNTLGDSITDMLIDNKSNGMTLQNSAINLLDNVDTLNKNSNEAAAALEETAAALEEITSNIGNNTQTVVNMAQYGKDVKNSVSLGQNLASQTTTAMDDINDEVTSISEAITVIDQIAFQTNILSLNAAVEAATAGEAGKGFAVVAQEVRNLASRSADAASEIKILVENANQKANSGKKIADEMISGYSHLNESITKTLNLISDVEMASKEQQKGIEQINDAISELDHQTQQNANVAGTTKCIAEQTNEIAFLVVRDANEKEFIGKKAVKAKFMGNCEIKEVNTHPNTSFPKEKSISKTITQKPKKVIVSNIADDEWASF